MTKTTAAIAFLAGLTAPAALVAQDGTPEVDPAELARCGQIADDGARLACYDALVRGTQEEYREVLQEQAEAEFGLDERRAQPAREPERRAQVAEDVTIASEVVSAVRQGLGSYVLTLANGQTWRTTEGGSTRFRFRGGERVEIEEGSFGGYRLGIAGRRGKVGVVRVN